MFKGVSVRNGDGGYCSRLMHRQERPAVCCLSCRKVKYLNMKGSLVDEHTVKGLTKAGKEVDYLFIHTFSPSAIKIYNHYRFVGLLLMKLGIHMKHVI